jgi:hypothetical protein
MPRIGVNTPCVIISKNNGVIYFNQTGGYACHDLEVEGFIIPLNYFFYIKAKDGEKSNYDNPYWNKYSFQEYFDELFAPLREGTKYNGHGYQGIDLEDVEYLEKAFNDDFLEIKIDRDRLRECEEARIFVKIKMKQYDQYYGEVEPFCADGILTWENSD